MVGVENLARAVGEHHPFAEGVEIAAGDVHPRLPPADADQAEREQKQHRHADDGEHCEEAEHQRLHAIALDQDEADRHTDQAEGEDDQAPGASDAVRPVAGRVEAVALHRPDRSSRHFISHKAIPGRPPPEIQERTFGSQPRQSAIRPFGRSRPDLEGIEASIPAGSSPRFRFADVPRPYSHSALAFGRLRSKTVLARQIATDECADRGPIEQGRRWSRRRQETPKCRTC